MSKKFTIGIIIFAFILAGVPSGAAQSPKAPSKGRWAFPLEGTLPLYEAPDAKSDSEQIELPEEWLKVPSAVRDSENNLWYKVKIGKTTGWLAQNGILLKMGPKSRTVSELYDKYAGNMKKAKKTPELFTTEDPSECKAFLGFNAIGMNEASIEKRLGTPTARLTDYIETQYTTFYYEFPGKNITFDVHMLDGKVCAIGLHNGMAGEVKFN